MNSSTISKTQVSDIFRTHEEQDDICNYLGFTISYADGSIENVVMEYQQDEFDMVMELMQHRRAEILDGLANGK
jgi:hypothetical protein